MFWGLILKGNRKYTQTIKKAFHLSHAALDITSVSNGSIQVVLTSDKLDFILCTLKKDSVEQVALDLNFEEGEELSFTSQGEGNVHLSGYFLDDMGQFEDDADEMITMPTKKNKKAAGKSAPAEEDDTDSEDGAEDDDSDDDEQEEDGQESDDDDDDDDEDDDEEDSDEEVEEPKPKHQKLTKPKENGIEKHVKPKGNAENSITKPKGEKVLAGGVKIEELKVGQGKEAKPGKKVQVYYEGRLKTNNKMFDSSKQGAGFKFALGKGEVIKGWDVGVVGMKVGGKRKITCPPHMAYGAKGSPPVIPSNSTLVFEVELKNVI